MALESEVRLSGANEAPGILLRPNAYYLASCNRDELDTG